MSRPLMLACVVMIVAGGCSESSPAAPTPTSPAAGSWTGTVSGGGATRTVRLTLVATLTAGDTSSAAGRYESVSSNGVVAGEASAIVAGTRLSLNLTPSPPQPCNVGQPFPADQMLLQLSLDGSRMAGDGAITLCGGSEPVQATFTKP